MAATGPSRRAALAQVHYVRNRVHMWLVEHWRAGRLFECELDRCERRLGTCIRLRLIAARMAWPREGELQRVREVDIPAAEAAARAETLGGRGARLELRA